MPIDARIPLGARAPQMPQLDVLGIAQFRQNRERAEQQDKRAAASDVRRNRLLELRESEFKRQQDAARRAEIEQSLLEGAVEFDALAQTGDHKAMADFFPRRRQQLLAQGLTTEHTDAAEQMFTEDPIGFLQKVKADISRAERMGTLTPRAGFNLSQGQTRFDASGQPIASVAPKPTLLTPEEEAQRARLRRAGRATTGAQNPGLASAKTEIFKNGVTIQALPGGKVEVRNRLGEVVTGQERLDTLKRAREEELAFQRTQSGEKAAGASAIKQSNEAIERIGKLKTAIQNMDRGIEALTAGASTGPFMSRLPSIRQAAIELDNVQSAMGLDVIGNTTFGALSESELAFALDTAMPRKLGTEALKNWLKEKKRVTVMLAEYLTDAAIFLGTPGNTPAKWLAAQKELAPNEVERIEFDDQGNEI